MSDQTAAQLTMLEIEPVQREKTRRKLGNAQNTIHYIEEARQAAHEQLQYSLASETSLLAYMLIQQKKLPNFYFIEEAKKAEIEPGIFNSWNIKDWPFRPVRRKDQLQDITLVLLRVRIRLWQYPQEETYWQAQDRLINRVRSLKKNGWTHNQIAQESGKSHSTLSEILTKCEGKRTRHCPWDMLEKLGKLEEKSKKIQEEQVKEKKAERKRNRVEQPPEPPSPITTREITRQIKEKRILPGDNCRRCQAPWSSMGPTREAHPLYPDTEYYKCFQCGQENLIGEIRPLIERRGACGHCGAGWHHMTKQDEKARDGSLVYLCMKCYDESRIIALTKTAKV